MPLDEKTLRKPEFAEGRKVTLGDGQEWTFPPTRVRLFPARDAQGKTFVAGAETFGPTFEDRLDAIVELEPEQGLERLALQFEMAGELLTRNYDLSAKQLQRLLTIDEGDPVSTERWDQVVNVLYGIEKKALLDGSDSASSPPESAPNP